MTTFLFRTVIVTLTLILFTVAHARIPTGGNQSALPYLLRGGRKDICLEENTLKDRGECLQGLLENYFGEYFTVSCGIFPVLLAEHRCTGCPWDRVNATEVYPSISRGLNRSQLFHPAEPTCSVANQVKEFSEPNRVRVILFVNGLFAAITVVFITAEYSEPSDGEGKFSMSGIHGYRFPEWFIMLGLWLDYHVANYYFILSEEYTELCSGETAKLTEQVARILFYVAVLLISMNRCRHFRVAGFKRDVQSWENYLKMKSRILRYVVDSIPIVIILLDTSLISKLLNSSLSALNICRAGTRDTPYLAFQILKVCLEGFTVIIYVFGPSRNRTLFYSRYSLLAFCFLFSCALLIPVMLGLASTEGTFIPSPKVTDTKVALPFTNLVHAMYISLMGLLEPLRIGWPGQLKNELVDEENEESALKNVSD